MKILIMILLFLILYSAAYSMVFPGTDWVEMSPESQGVDSAKLDQAMNYLNSQVGSDGIREVVVIRNGYMIYKGDNIDNKHGVWSCTKAFTSTVMGLLYDDGILTPETYAKDHVSSLSSQYQNVKLKHFASMTSGYDAEGGVSYGGGYEFSDTPWVPTDPMFAPGVAYFYCDDATNMMGHVLTQIAGEPMDVLFKRRIADEIGMDPAKWEWKDYGVVDGIVLNGGAGFEESGMHVSAREMARFGHLFLNNGNWNGKQLLSTDWIAQATSVQVPAPTPLFRDIRDTTDYPYTDHLDIVGPGRYGYHWWTNGIMADGSRNMPDSPLGTFYRSGYNDNYVLIIPEWDMVIVRLGLDETVTSGNTAPLWNDVLKLIGEAILSPDLTLLYPGGGEVLNAGETFEITWTSEGIIEYLKIDYSVNNGIDWIEIVESTENDGFYTWKVPNTPSDECLIKISDVDGDTSDENGVVFTITPPVCKADFNVDGIVNETDLSIFSIAMGDTNCSLWPTHCDCDIEGDDNDIDGLDLSILADDFGREDCP